MQTIHAPVSKKAERVCHWFDECRGQYIPQAFATCWKDRELAVEGVSDQDWFVLETGPNHEHYWDTWNDVEQNAKIYLEGRDSPHFWRIYNDGGCYLIRNDVEWCDECGGWKDADCGCDHTNDEEE